jgi:hypothetical protein
LVNTCQTRGGAYDYCSRIWRPFCNVDAKTRSRKTKAATKEEEYKKQYYVRTRILIIDDEPDITLYYVVLSA